VGAAGVASEGMQAGPAGAVVQVVERVVEVPLSARRQAGGGAVRSSGLLWASSESRSFHTAGQFCQPPSTGAWEP
jgi:hypothetical protein